MNLRCSDNLDFRTQMVESMREGCGIVGWSEDGDWGFDLRGLDLQGLDRTSVTIRHAARRLIYYLWGERRQRKQRSLLKDMLL
jgi:hypothetical protein